MHEIFLSTACQLRRKVAFRKATLDRIISGMRSSSSSHSWINWKKVILPFKLSLFISFHFLPPPPSRCTHTPFMVGVDSRGKQANWLTHRTSVLLFNSTCLNQAILTQFFTKKFYLLSILGLLISIQVFPLNLARAIRVP